MSFDVGLRGAELVDRGDKSLSAATTGRISLPVTMRTSSIAKMLAGSAIATTSSSSSTLMGSTT